MTFLYWVEIVLFVCFLINIVYLLFFSIASLNKGKQLHNFSFKDHKRIAILIPAYKEDQVIVECVHSCMQQVYPKDKYDIVVISDRMEEETNISLSALPIKLVKVFFKNSTKAKALNFAMEQIGDSYDIAVVLDADNVIYPDFLNKMDEIFSNPHVQIVQAHRKAKNLNTNLSVLDAVSEEINNSIFRLGHARVGLSAALIGSGMAFGYSLFKEIMLTIDAVGGFDRALELSLIKEGKRIYYLPEVDVLDEKVQSHANFSNQRRRWLSAQIHYLGKFIGDVPAALLKGNWDFCDKVFQQMSIPRILLVGITFIIAFGLSIIQWNISIKWWVIFWVLVFSLLISIPKELFNKKLLVALFELPYSFLLMCLNLFRLKGANKKFIHTKHGTE
ncbi:glycosyltransferase [Parabacteroides chongii]|uniref:glycosyltransferase n=1 Tax=Parabacteroides chongii TaxID=2685834 RepID=UPI00240D7BCB|nr:glycosyltransferase family 2 protein [Parabacteroides chongii]WFE83631.1 glycosyltransferase family 2 protein [Parabacteroides chongii]